MSVFVGGRSLSEFTPGWKAEWVIEGLWQTRGVNMLCGAPRTRKSTLNAYFTVCALTGTKVFGIIPVTPIQRAAVFFGEGIAEAEASRFYDVFVGLGIDPAPYKNRITVFGPQPTLRFDPNFNLEPHRKELEQEGYDFVSFDPLVNFHGQEENTSKMAAVMAQITAFTEFATVSLPHHVAKPNPGGPPKSLSHMARGHSSIAGYTAVNMVLERTGEEHTLKTDAKYTEKYSELDLRFVEGIWVTKEEALKRLVVKLAKEGQSRNSIVANLHIRRADALKLTEQVLGPAEGK